VQLGVRRGAQVEIVEGVSEGETVVVAGQQRLQRDGTPVRVVDMSRPGGSGGKPGQGAGRPGGTAAGGAPGAGGKPAAATGG
jgi:membrane fusion protein (multidrug efflux system)